MSSLFGFHFKHRNNRSSIEILQLMAGKSAKFLDNNQYSKILPNGLGIASHPASIAESSSIVASIEGSPNWTDTELSRIASEQGISQALLVSYERNQTKFLQYIQGQFCFAIFDKRSETTIIGVDRIGTKSLYYYVDEKYGVIFSSNANKLINHPSIQCKLADQGIFNYLYFHMVPSPGSIFSEIKKLGPAQYLTITDNKADIREYWQPVFHEKVEASIHHLNTQLEDLLSISVAESACQSLNVGCFLSGGIDSSTVVGTLSKISSEPVKTFSIGFDAAGYDETPYARIVANEFATSHHEYYVTPDDVVDFVPKMAAACAEPFGNASAIPAYFCAKLARENGVNLLLAGDGGDEIFAGNERYVKQAIFEKYFVLPSSMRKNIIEPALKLMPGTERFTLLRKLASYIQQANTPLPDRLEAYNFLRRISINEMFEPNFLNKIDTHEPINLIRDRYNALSSITNLNRMLYQDWKFTLADNDLRKVTQMAELADIEVAYPLLADRVIELSCRVPSHLKIKQHNLRYFFKQAIKELLPKEILKKKKHGFGLPFGVWMKDHKPLQELAYDSINQLKKRGYFQPDFLDRAIDLHRTGHAAYYGGLIWILMVLELWIDTHSNHSK